MMNRYKNILIGLMLSLTLILGACGNGNVSAGSAVASQENQSEVSAVYKDQLDIFAKTNVEQSNMFVEMMNALSKRPELLDNTDFKKDYIIRTKKHTNVLKRLEFTPETDADKEIDKIAQETLLDQLLTCDALMLFLDDASDASQKNLTIKIGTLEVHSDELVKMKQKHGF